MHELGVVIEIAKQVIAIAEANSLEKVDTIVLQIGELSPMIPKFIEECYPAAIDRTILQNTKLKIDILPANGLCNNCKKVFAIVEHKGECPNCKTKSFEILSGKEFILKEIIAC